MKDYPVRHRIRHNGECYAAGHTITLDYHAATPLRIARAIGDGVEKAAPAGHGDRQAALVAAARSLDRNTADLWTNGGLPQIAALEAASGLNGVTAAERDAAWAEVG